MARGQLKTMTERSAFYSVWGVLRDVVIPQVTASPGYEEDRNAPRPAVAVVCVVDGCLAGSRCSFFCITCPFRFSSCRTDSLGDMRGCWVRLQFSHRALKASCGLGFGLVWFGSGEEDLALRSFQHLGVGG